MMGTENRDMVICNNCLWAASLLNGLAVYTTCPVCKGSIETIPVSNYESYTMNIRNKTVEIEFTKE